MSQPTPAALDHLRVVELGDFISAPYAGKLLADLGADVIKVESPAGDGARAHGPFPDDEPHPERSGLFLFLNANKRSVVLDLDTTEGRADFERLVGWADVLLHNVPPADLERWGLTYEQLSEQHPELVMVSITVFGYDTPYRDWKGYALNATVASGISYRIGDADRSPLWLPFCAADFQGGVHGAVAAMLALRARRQSGEGQHAWLSIVEVMGVYLGGAGIPTFVFQGQLRGRAGKHMAAFYPWQVAAVADGYFEVITMVDAQWQRFVELMGNPPWREDERLENRWLAFQWADELDEYWHPWLRARTKDELAELFAANHIAFQPVQTLDEVVASAHLAERGFWQEVEHPVAGRYRTLGAPYGLSETPWAIRRPPPLLGQHTDEVLDALRAGVAAPAPAAGADGRAR
ncbi:MAG: CoA transferase [Chloroflexi bacterium]|nr:CoA transferase [Chloroflexota bacterium]